MKIATNKFVSVTYDLFVGEGEELSLMEQATREVPLDFLYGTGVMLPSFEEKLKGLGVGDKFEFVLSPAEAYGDYDEENQIELPKSAFEVDGQFDSEMVQEGRVIPMMDSEGNRLNGSVMEVGEDTVLLDFNHPLAGETLHFSGEVIAVRLPTEKDIKALSHDHCCGCGCDCDCEGDEACDCGCGGHHH
ncbi:MAG: FKBP-type peptidyl-prolyl cis-trans isomerase [Tannerella sp.]|jgi:FKBP-type peptidyl-prolyl cis-trans isomerase SlyD|nr:FKBP-type peptidyl-prolyl cis-trans isomerase [Tannerella sp.]